MDKLIEEIDEILAPLPAWLAQFRDEQGRYRYVRASKKTYCLYATLEGLSLADLLGAGNKGKKHRESALNFMRECQSAADGYFRCPTCSSDPNAADCTCPESNRDGLTFKAAATLFMAGVTPAYPLPDGDMLAGDVGQGLENFFMQNDPYSAGSLVWKKVGMYGLKVLSTGRDPMRDSYLRRVMEWLLDHQDKATGFWFPRGDLRNGMNGLLKMRFGTFDLCGQDIPNPEQVVASILTLPSPETGRFGEACDDWNGVGLLAEIGRRVPASRDKILAVYRRIMPAMRAKRDLKNGGLTWGQGGEAYLKPTFINAVGLLAMKAFVLKDDKTIDNIFFMRLLRRELLKKAQQAIGEAR